MMNISIITFHNTSNFGATLQCSALYAFLSKLGHNVKVINYLPTYVLDKKSVFKEIRKVRESNNKAKALVKGIAYLNFSNSIKRKDARFEKFISEHINTTRVYSSFAELESSPPISDLYICGSDQIWNPALTGDAFDKAYFLQFIDGDKVSYGASIGELDIENAKEELCELTNDFKYISVREKTSATKLAKALGREIFTVLDCTLLLNKDDYIKMEVDTDYLNSKYLLLYNIQNSHTSVEIAQKIAREKNLKIIDISPNPFVKVADALKLIDIGPGEFLSLFHHAEYVVTNSFHGSVFSIIYEKQFITIPHSTRSTRITDLLKSLDLDSRIALKSGYIDYVPIDYSNVKKNLQIARSNSIEFLDLLFENENSKYDAQQKVASSALSQMNCTNN